MLFTDQLSQWKEVGYVTENHENNGITVRHWFTVIPLFSCISVTKPTYFQNRLLSTVAAAALPFPPYYKPLVLVLSLFHQVFLLLLVLLLAVAIQVPILNVKSEVREDGEVLCENTAVAVGINGETL
jgi:hypothetical protein